MESGDRHALCEVHAPAVRNSQTGALDGAHDAAVLVATAETATSFPSITST